MELFVRRRSIYSKNGHNNPAPLEVFQPFTTVGTRVRTSPQYHLLVAQGDYRGGGWGGVLRIRPQKPRSRVTADVAR